MKSKIIKEISIAIKAIPDGYVKQLIDEIKNSSRVFLWGLGRSGMMARAFAMRLRHLELESYFIAGLCPPVRKGDLLIVVSKTGRSKMLLPPVEAAIKSKAKTLCITTTNNKISRICNKSLILKLPESIQFGGSLFEQTVLIFFDEIVEKYRQKMGISFERMKRNHANWE
ncbi:MAG: SIS domain-containing protein [Candidatus Omnitrophica bacterium]|nr:SIS domain-containing protein [Candidatus Omnitrophota bacterium]MCM8822236.1 SIS domain-containing protein [Candidatus Omnitrophota bacterium]MCM8824649.1 SIS domain-containing protein [Candidatus Omnitrophota bacterium]MCM8828478.1 SIS domain-containing protein [Candidatus Omnitrophota bacterium]